MAAGDPLILGELFTIQSVLTLTGATGATYVVANGIQRAFDVNPKWLALAIAQIVSLVGVGLTNPSFSSFFIGVLNGFLIFCTATGANTLTGTPPPEPVARSAAEAAQPQRVRRGFLTRW